MLTYDELVARAEDKGIRTFGDAMLVLGADGRDIFGDDYTEDLDSEYLYPCDGAQHLLESLAESQLI